MGTNSIRTNLCKSDIISTIRMSLSADLEKVDSYMVVEGQDDMQFWRHKLSNNVSLLESFSGKTGVSEIVSYFDQPNVIGICDQDYDVEVSHKYIYFYDCSCLEMMMVKSDSAFQAFISEYYYDTRIQEFRMNALKNLKWISCFRLLNSKNAWGINFSGFSIANAFDKSRNSFCISRGINELASKNSMFHDRHGDKLQVVEHASTSNLDFIKLLEITNGHDFLGFVHCTYMVHKGTKSKTLAIGALSASLRTAYRMSDFENTTLYTKLREFESVHNIAFLAS